MPLDLPQLGDASAIRFYTGARDKIEEQTAHDFVGLAFFPRLPYFDFAQRSRNRSWSVSMLKSSNHGLQVSLLCCNCFG